MCRAAFSPCSSINFVTSSSCNSNSAASAGQSLPSNRAISVRRISPFRYRSSDFQPRKTFVKKCQTNKFHFEYLQKFDRVHSTARLAFVPRSKFNFISKNQHRITSIAYLDQILKEINHVPSECKRRTI